MDINYALNVMNVIDRQWLDASLEMKQRFQELLFPEGLTYDYKAGRFGAIQIQ